MGQPVVQWQILTPAPDALAAFYGALFGWDIKANNQLGYRMVDTASGRGIPGGIWPAPPSAPTFVQLFVAVDDVQAIAARTTELGGAVLIPPQHLPDGDEVAILRDPQGLTFGVMKSVRE
jgi:predicted enzyme related to lactoylglutathione lyase